jgi:hypothetical protein
MPVFVVLRWMLADWPQFRGPDAKPVGTDSRLPGDWLTEGHLYSIRRPK